MVEGTIVLEENRSVIDKFRFWYKENIIDTNKAKEFEDKLDKGVEIAKTTVYVAGGIATVVLAICPVDGPVGEAIAIAATPLLAKVVEAGAVLIKDTVIGTKRYIEENIVHENGKSENISENVSFDKVVEDVNLVKTLGDEINNSFGGRTL